MLQSARFYRGLVGIGAGGSRIPVSVLLVVFSSYVVCVGYVVCVVRLVCAVLSGYISVFAEV